MTGHFVQETNPVGVDKGIAMVMTSVVMDLNVDITTVDSSIPGRILTRIVVYQLIKVSYDTSRLNTKICSLLQLNKNLIDSRSFYGPDDCTIYLEPLFLDLQWSIP